MENTTKTSGPEPLTEVQILAEQFFSLYRGLYRAYGSFKILPDKSEIGKIIGRAKTEIKNYTVKLWNAHLTGEQGLGVIPIMDDGTCWWGAIDIDVYPLDLIKLEKRVQELGLPLVTIKTKSGGAHLTMFLLEPVSCKLVRNRLYEFAMILGYGGVEIFPKQVMLASDKDVGNWLNMPYFEYADTSRYAILNGTPLSAIQFLDLARAVRITETQLRSVEVELRGEFEDGPPCLQMLSKSGAPEGTRNNTLFAYGVYCKKKYEDEWEEKVEDMNARYINPPLKSKEVQITIKSVGRKDYFYPCNKAPLMNVCNKELCRKRKFGIGQGEEFNINLGSLIKITTEPPVWIIDVEGIRIQMDTEDFMQQQRFRKVCMMNINKLPPLIKNSEWEKLVRDKLSTVEIIEAPAESRAGARISQYAYQYLMVTPPARTKEEMLLGRPWHDRETNSVYFRGNDLIKYLENQGIKAEPRKVWTSLRDNGADHTNLRVKNVTTSVWKLPADCVPDMRLDLPPDMNEDF